MSFLQFLRGDVENVMSGVDQQKQIVSNTLDSIKSLVPRVTMSWIGGDANEFAADVMRKIVPAMLELIAAIAGVNLNLTKATNIIDQADSKVKSLADGIGDLFSGIC
jgi:uncharacterized protein YukE